MHNLSAAVRSGGRGHVCVSHKTDSAHWYASMRKCQEEIHEKYKKKTLIEIKKKIIYNIYNQFFKEKILNNIYILI